MLPVVFQRQGNAYQLAAEEVETGVRLQWTSRLYRTNLSMAVLHKC